MSMTLDSILLIVKPHNDRIVAGHAKQELELIVGHLGAAVCQLLPSDDQIIADHIRKAETLAVQALRRLVAITKD